MDKETNKKKNASSKKSATKTNNKTATKEGVKKVAASKAATKSSSVKKVEAKKETTPVLVQEVKEEVKTSRDNEVECRFCHKTFEKGYNICPHCHKRQKSEVGIVFFGVFAFVFLFAIICFYFVDKYFDRIPDAKDYKESTVLVNYENLVRNAKDYKGKDVKVIGKVVSVSGIDDGFGNKMVITIDANLFDTNKEQLITIDFVDHDYTAGIMNGDTITVYGNYTTLNGNVPNIDAKFITIG